MYKYFKTYITGTLVLAIMVLLGYSPLQAQTKSQGNNYKSSDSNAKTVVDVVKSTKNVSKFAKLLDKSGFAKILNQQNGQFTVLAPDNDAIENANSKLKKNPKMLVQKQLLQGKISKKQVESKLGVKVEKTDNSASNGTVYVVNKLVSRSQQQQQQQQSPQNQPPQNQPPRTQPPQNQPPQNQPPRTQPPQNQPPQNQPPQ
jgi:uncharacterized surface protein with fasciclin (FAS1) repeats